ncbi:MAG: protein kinase, partial [Phycisphaerae bacterium]|nr:protein kinase [Phycisphaerae bacterium]
MKHCPYCDEEIRDNAVKCKHCGSTVGRNMSAPGPADTLDGAQTIHADAIRPGKVLAGRYRIIEQLGSGGMGEVYQAADAEMDDMPVAIKVLPPVLARNKRSIEALKREAAVSLRLSHPNICRLHNFSSDGEIKFLVMEYIDGLTIDQMLDDREDRQVAWPELAPIAEQIAGALDYAHRVAYSDAGGRQVKGILHRDIKPQNIMVTADGQAKLMDFGIAREIHNTMTMVTGRTSQTPLYASPEQFRGEPMTPASDLYSFTVVLYECLAGRPLVTPHGDLGYQILQNPYSPLDAQGEAVNAALSAGLSKDPSNRP